MARCCITDFQWYFNWGGSDNVHLQVVYFVRGEIPYHNGTAVMLIPSPVCILCLPVDGNFRNGVKLSEVEVNFKLVHLSNLATFCHDFEFHLELATIFCMESVEV